MEEVSMLKIARMEGNSQMHVKPRGQAHRTRKSSQHDVHNWHETAWTNTHYKVTHCEGSGENSQTYEQWKEEGLAHTTRLPETRPPVEECHDIHGQNRTSRTNRGISRRKGSQVSRLKQGNHKQFKGGYITEAQGILDDQLPVRYEHREEEEELRNYEWSAQIQAASTDQRWCHQSSKNQATYLSDMQRNYETMTPLSG
jgi:hypothetical protein